MRPIGTPIVVCDACDDGIVFWTDGWYDVLMAVAWDPAATGGTRFSHTKIPGQEPLHSEAISADVLAQLSDGRQLLRRQHLVRATAIDLIRHRRACCQCDPPQTPARTNVNR